MFDITPDLKALSLGISFKMRAFTGLSKSRLRKELRKSKEQENTEVETYEEKILSNIGSYNDYFEKYGFNCPLSGQFSKTKEAGIPGISPLIEILQTSEMTTGVLMGIHDYSEIRGRLVVDIANHGETFAGVRGLVQCKEGEVVIRDDEGIIASYFQGADDRTALKSNSKDVIVFCFGAPSMPESQLDAALMKANGYFEPACSEVLS